LSERPLRPAVLLARYRPLRLSTLARRLTDPRRLAAPIPFRGRLGLFTIDDELIEPPGAAEPQPVTGSGQLALFPPEPQAKAKSEKPGQSQAERSVSEYQYRTEAESRYDPDHPFELRVVPQPGGGSDYGLSLYQWPIVANGAAGQAQPRQPQRLVELAGDTLRAVADHILLALRQGGYKPTDLSATRRKPFYLDEETGLRLGLLFLAIKPLNRLDRIEAISGGLRVMPSEEAYYWFSKCTAESSAANAQRALRILLAGE
jgi:hypothetical protein